VTAARRVQEDERRLTFRRALLLAPAVALIVSVLAFPITLLYSCMNASRDLITAQA